MTKQLLGEVEVEHDYQKYVGIVYDEMKIKEGLVAAKQILVFMVRGIFTRLKFPYAQYARGITGSSLFFLAWEVIRNLEVAGFNVISLTGDRASPNRRFTTCIIVLLVSPGLTPFTKCAIHTVQKRGIYISSLMYPTL